jgi:hypothetical protein
MAAYKILIMGTINKTTFKMLATALLESSPKKRKPLPNAKKTRA